MRTKGICPTCGTKQTLKADGCLWLHTARTEAGRINHNGYCQSSFKLPAEAGGTPVDCEECGKRRMARGPHDCEIQP